MNMSAVCPISGQTRHEEFWNSLTHGLGSALSIVGLSVVVIYAALHGEALHIISTSIYGVALVLLFTASTLYHSATHLVWKRRWLLADYSCIYLLIAGTYTPFALVSLHGPWGWSLFGVEWGLALVGIITKCILAERYPVLSTVAYLLMGWAGLAVFIPLYEQLPGGALVLLLCGGLAYSVGALFFLWESLRYNHVIWHLFVIAGSAFHYCAILYYVVP